MTLADRIAVMKDGELQQLGTPKEIYNKPNNMFVAGFMGSPSMNFIHTMVDLDSNDNPVIKVVGTNEQEHHIKLPDSMRDQDGKKVVIGLRPEHITEQPGEDESVSTQLDLLLEVLEPTGPDTIAMVKVNDQEIACRLSPEFDVSVGQVAPLHFDLSKAVIFDAATEQRIAY
ncbi:ABC transporter: ATP-binding protein (fragment) [Vibrio tapetis subsp. tapetis]|uniref:ABC transporter: ATP-binding protein n=1 Tax=Vibrio tapetis subsp. tapetis TaxID=1671868 RepID=A0A2N8ZDN1_9VIBR